MDINEYITSQMSGKIERRGNSPWPAALTTMVGIAILIVTYTSHLDDIIQTTLLTLGFILIATGIIWGILCLTKTLWHYHYLPTNSPMREKTLYLSTEDFRNCSEILESGNTDALKTLSPIVSSNLVLHVIYSNDRSIALLQTCRMETSQQEPASSVTVLTGADVCHLSTLIH